MAENEVFDTSMPVPDAPKGGLFGRKPKPQPVATLATNKNGKPNIAMFIDVDNVGISRENLLEVLFYANGRYNVSLCRLYGFSETTLPGIKEIATEYNMTTIGKMQFKKPGQNCLDSRLLIDAYDCALKNAKNLDTIFIWSYPCDLENLFEKIIACGVSTATIDNRAFDCKNRFVSQTFKLFSNYNFTFEGTYGQPATPQPPVTPTPVPVPTPQPQPAIAPAPVPVPPEPIPPVVPQPQPQPTPVPVTPEIEPVKEPEPEPELEMETKPEYDTLDGKPIPVLPRREIPEKGKPLPKTEPEPVLESATNPTPDDNDSESDDDLIKSISGKLNIPMDDGNNANAPVFDIMEMLRKAGLSEGNGPKKYEDTLGDL